jgi:hypothetical protein
VGQGCSHAIAKAGSVPIREYQQFAYNGAASSATNAVAHSQYCAHGESFRLKLDGSNNTEQYKLELIIQLAG